MARTDLALALSPNALGATGALDVPAGWVGNGLEGFWRTNTSVTALVSGKFSQIDDESGHARHVTQGTALFRPAAATVNGVRCAAADGGQMMVVPAAFGAALGTNNYMLWSVVETDDVGASECIFATAGTGGASEDIESGNVCARHKGVAVLSDGAAVLSLVELWVLLRAAGTSRLYRNGVEVALSTPTAGVGAPSGTGTLLALDDALTLSWSGRGREWGGLSRVPSSQELADLYDYARTLYGLT